MRYFLFHYTFVAGVQSGRGNLFFSHKTFPSMKWVKEQFMNDCPKGAKIVISGWNEFNSKEDFDCFTEGYKNG